MRRGGASKQAPGAPHEVLLVLDATTGQNGLSRPTLHQAADLTGVVLTKLDGTARGGIAFAIRRELGMPVKLVGTGEKLEDLGRVRRPGIRARRSSLRASGAGRLVPPPLP